MKKVYQAGLLKAVAMSVLFTNEGFCADSEEKAKMKGAAKSPKSVLKERDKQAHSGDLSLKELSSQDEQQLYKEKLAYLEAYRREILSQPRTIDLKEKSVRDVLKHLKR